MRRISTLLEVMMSAILLVAGLYVLHEAGLNKSLNETVVMIGGAVCLSLGLQQVFGKVWHRKYQAQNYICGRTIEERVSSLAFLERLEKALYTVPTPQPSWFAICGHERPASRSSAMRREFSAGEVRTCQMFRADRSSGTCC